MKHLNFFKSALLTLLILCSNFVWAHDFEVDGIFYNVIDETNQTVEVTYKGTTAYEYSKEYSGNIVIPETVTFNEADYRVEGIAQRAFCECSTLINIDIPNSIIYIEEYAFTHCTKLENINLSNSLTKIERGTFYGCTNLIKVNIPDNVTGIGENAFAECEHLEEIKLGKGVEYIDKYAFKNCSAFTRLIIPNNVIKIDNFVFENCTALNELIIEDGKTPLEMGYMTYRPDLGDLQYRSIFYNSPLKQVYIGRNLQYDIEAYPIYSPFQSKYQLTNVYIGKCVTTLGEYLFRNCTSLENIYFHSNPTIGTDAIPSTATCHLILDDSNMIDFNTANSNTYSDVSYTRIISERRYGTIMLPFAPNTASLENYAFYELAESSDRYMRFEEVATPIANVPYIYTLRDGKENVAITGGETSISSNIVTPEVDGWQTVGSFSNQTIDTSNGNYYALSATDNEINRITKNLTVLPYRAYFKSSNASKSALSIYISGTTGVKEISSSEIDGFENGGIFDLSGRKVTEPTKGNLYIVNGKKIIF
ncbi:MAG: leucine-rich repeat domain-containing protein [Bacteroidaceae bacterium]|nr:leucine-rich repeat domain-containing protein [Bacteroidaceae bacterium]